ncbi:MAG TPA: hypothetical protein VF590_26480, partial [Isosphaeraceae bacterium]
WALDCSPDGQRILSGGQDHLMILWDVETGRELRRFQGHTRGVIGAAFSPDGRRALSGSDGRGRLDSPGSVRGRRDDGVRAMSFRRFLLQYFLVTAFLLGLFGRLMLHFYPILTGREYPSDMARAGLLTQVVIGLLISVMLTASVAVFNRVTTVVIPLGSQDLLSRLDDQMAKLRYRPGARSENSLVFVPKALVHPRVFHVHVGIGPNAITLVGPGAVVRALEKRIAPGRAHDE